MPNNNNKTNKSTSYIHPNSWETLAKHINWLVRPPSRPKAHTGGTLQPQSISRCKNCSLNWGLICPPSIGRHIQELWQPWMSWMRQWTTIQWTRVPQLVHKTRYKNQSLIPLSPIGKWSWMFQETTKKAIQIGLEKRCPIQEIIYEILHDYPSTSHPATGLTPGDMILRGGYQTKFPQRTNSTENQIYEAKIDDSHRKEVANAKINASCWRKYPKIIQGDKVLVKRSSKTNKFVSQFDPTTHMVTDVQCSRYELVADNDYHNARTIFRHISDIKLYKPYQHPQRYHPHPVQTQI